MRMRGGSAEAFWAACWAEHEKPDFTAAGSVPPVHPAGAISRGAVRCAAAIPAAVPPLYGSAGRRLLSGCRCGGLSVSAGAGGRRTAGIHAVGGAGGNGFVFLRLGPLPAADLGILDGCTAASGAAADVSVGKTGGVLQKNPALREKALLFWSKILYNRENWVHLGTTKRRRRTWQEKSAQKRKPAPRPAS